MMTVQRGLEAVETLLFCKMGSLLCLYLKEYFEIFFIFWPPHAIWSSRAGGQIQAAAVATQHP